MYSVLLLLWSLACVRALEITAPAKGQTWNVNEPLTVSWDVAPQGDPESFSVLFMKPGSENYVILAVDTKSSAKSIDLNFPHDEPIEGVAGFVIAFVDPPSTYYAVSNTINISSEPLPASRAPASRAPAAKDARAAVISPSSAPELSIPSTEAPSSSQPPRRARTNEAPISTEPSRGAPTPASSSGPEDMLTTQKVGAALAASARPSASSLGVVDVSTSSASAITISMGTIMLGLVCMLV